MIRWYFKSLWERQNVQQMVWRQMAITLEDSKVRFLPCIKHQFFFYCAGSLLQHTGFSLVAGHRLPSCGVRAVEHAASAVAAHRFSSCHVLA